MTPIESLTLEQILLELSYLAKLKVISETDKEGNCKIELRAVLKKPKTEGLEVLCVDRTMGAVDLLFGREVSQLVRRPFEMLLLAVQQHSSE